jgi:hypothetical protein
MKTLRTSFTPFALKTSMALFAFFMVHLTAVCAEPVQWKLNPNVIRSYTKMCGHTTSTSYIQALAADADRVYGIGDKALVFVSELGVLSSPQCSELLDDMISETGRVHFTPSGTINQDFGFQYADYYGHIGQEDFFIRQYTVQSPTGTLLFRILLKPDVSGAEFLSILHGDITRGTSPLLTNN